MPEGNLSKISMVTDTVGESELAIGSRNEKANGLVKRYYRPELDVLRFFAFLFVFITHRNDLAPIDPVAHPWYHAFTMTGVYGVPLFFLLSAFLITELLEREREKTGRINVRAFYIRRILRIWPLYFLIFFGLAFLNQFLPGAGAVTSGKWLSFMLFAGNWYITFNGWIEYPVNPMWSLSVEEQFYIAIPFLAMLGRRAIMGVNIAVLAVAYAVIVYYAQGFPPKPQFSGQWTNSFVQFQFFAGGMLLALFLRGRRPDWHITIRVGLFALAVISWIVAFKAFGIKADFPHSSVAHSLAGWPLVLIGAVLMLVSLLGTPERYLPRPLVYLGRISYGMYLIHIFFFWIVYDKIRPWLTRMTQDAGVGDWRDNIGMVLAFAATVSIASLLYRYFETPFLKWKRRFTTIPSRD
ncbi:acyltransferase family protein [Sphingobium lactosutens]|uniref:acyltransferase family protein n=1 Tax=Sphingobium lactosutens TaxID=522773 RepID=UPI0015B7B0D6|nr:acyltransferase [Sphingobium lactosutens]